MNEPLVTSNDQTPDIDAALTLDAALGKIANTEGESWVTLRESEAAALVTEIDRLNKLVPAPAHETRATPETSIDMAHSQAHHAFANRHGGKGPSLPSEDRWVDGYMHALLDIGRSAQKASTEDWRKNLRPPDNDEGLS